MNREANYVIEKITGAGYEAYLVGGCVRDFVMGKPPKDFDVTTNAMPDEIHGIFERENDIEVIDTGIKHGTVTVIKNGIPIEVTTYRTETKYSDGRHPDEVHFTRSLEEDLARRDFTMNAIAYSPTTSKSPRLGDFVDPFNGQADIENGIIRCVGNPRERLSEDALRIMRALRFASELDFEIEGETSKALHEMKDRLELISKERIQKELEGLLCGIGVERVLREYADIIEVIIPEISPMIGFEQNSPFHIYDVWEHTLKVIANIPPRKELRLTALFHDIGKPSCYSQGSDGVGHFYGHPLVSYDLSDGIMKRLRFDNGTRNAVLTLVKWHDLRPKPMEKNVRKVISKVTPELFDWWICIRRADNKGQAPILKDSQIEISQIEEIGQRLIREESVFSIKELKINGSDLIELGVKEGPMVGRILDDLLDEVMEENIPNEKESLIEAARWMLA